MGLQANYSGILTQIQNSLNLVLPSTQQINSVLFGDGNPLQQTYPVAQILFGEGTTEVQTASYFTTDQEMHLYFYFNSLSQSDILGFIDTFFSWYYPENQNFGQQWIIQSKLRKFAFGADPSGDIGGYNGNLMTVGFIFDVVSQINVF